MDLPKRKLPRLNGYDYSAPGAYFITICTHNKKHLFSDIVGAIHESPENRLSPYGKLVEKLIGQLPARFDFIIPKYVIMPNHIHLIIEIKNDITTRAIRESPLQHHRSVIDKAVGFLKMNVSKAMRPTYADKIWQRSYHDHIIRGGADYRKIWEYIDTNPLKWEKDCFYNLN
ncbi:MAG: transposase [Clostridia bacterium]|nr:transposase [Clostridia bacterium]